MLAVKGIDGLIFAVCCIMVHPASLAPYNGFESCVYEVQRSADTIFKKYTEEHRMPKNVLQQRGRPELLEIFPKLPNCTVSETPTHEDIQKVLNAFREHFESMKLTLAQTRLVSLNKYIPRVIERLNCLSKSSTPSPRRNLEFPTREPIDQKEAVYYALEFFKNCSAFLSSKLNETEK